MPYGFSDVPSAHQAFVNEVLFELLQLIANSYTDRLFLPEYISHVYAVKVMVL